MIQFLQQFAIRIFIEDGVLRALCETGGSEVTAEALSKRTGENELLIGMVQTDC